ncbi:MAG TPA: hypothetical protein VNI20_03850 [Fimbriimonadaceae bacterium]|nr:hypothetical protein [Fimbriimonadaceae bacterium]
MNTATTNLLRALSGLQRVQLQVTDTIRKIDPNSHDLVANHARQKARSVQVQAQQKASEVASVLRRSVLDVQA